MKIAKTRSSFPMVIGIVGGILAIIGGACVAFVGELAAASLTAIQAEFPNFNLGMYTMVGYAILVVGVATLVCGCIAKSNKFGSLLVTILGGVYLVLFIILTVMAGLAILHLVVSVLFIVGGFMGMTHPVIEEPVTPPPSM